MQSQKCLGKKHTMQSLGQVEELELYRAFFKKFEKATKVNFLIILIGCCIAVLLSLSSLVACKQYAFCLSVRAEVLAGYGLSWVIVLCVCAMFIVFCIIYWNTGKELTQIEKMEEERNKRSIVEDPCSSKA